MSTALLAQSPPPIRAFEVASVRTYQGNMSRLNQVSTSGPRLSMEAVTVVDLLIYAYNLENYQISRTAPLVALDETYFDIVAKAPGDDFRTKAEFRQMVQMLLADRFKLRVHRGVKEFPVYALLVGKGGPKFKESAPDAEFAGRHGVNGRNQNLTLSKATMEMLAGEIQGYFGVNRPVLDQTGLAGAYDIKLEATPESRINRNPIDPGEISVFDAVRQQLGLRLEARKAALEILVVDHVEKPSGN